MNHYAPDTPKKIVPFAPGQKAHTDESDLDRSGEAIVALLQEAAEVARGNSEHAIALADKLSNELRAAEDRARAAEDHASAVEDRAKLLEADLRHYQDRAFRAEKWLLRIYKEIQAKFFDQDPVQISAQKWG